MNRAVATGFAVAGILSWLWPGFDGFFSSTAEIGAGESRIIGSIFMVGAAVVWFIRPDPKS